MKKIVEVRSENEAYRKYGVTADFPISDKGYSTHYDGSKGLDPETDKLRKALLAVDGVREVSMWPGEVTVMAKLAWADSDGWAAIAPVVRQVLNDHFFEGQAEIAFRAR